MPVNNKIKIRRGNNIDLPSGGTESGELRYSIDTKELYIDDGSLNIKIGGDPYAFPVSIAQKAALDLKQTVFTGICQEQFLTENDIVIDNTALTLTIATVKNGQAISALNPICFYTDGNGTAVKHEKSTPVVFNFTNTDGVWYFYFNSNGDPIATQTLYTDFSTIASVYRFYWNSTLSVSERRVIESIEYHKNDISWADHMWKHSEGTKYLSGFDISHNATPSATPNINGSNAVVTLSSGSNIDDNMEYSVTHAASGSVKFTQNLGTGLLPATSGKFICISNDASLRLQKIPATDFPFLWNATTNIPQYLTPTGVRTDVSNGYFFVYYIYALQDPRYGEAIKIKSAETHFASSTLAAAHNWEQLQAIFPTLRDEEIRLLYKLTFEYKSAYNIGTKKAALRTVDDLRKQKTTTTATAGGLLPATSVVVSPIGNIASTNVQSALQELDSEKQPVGTYSTDIHSNITALNDVLGSNHGDETLTSIKTKLGAATAVSDGYLKYQDFTSFDGKVSNATHTGDVTGSTALTLATVNSNVGTYNNVTINAKGLATAGSNVSYEPPFSKNTAFNKNFGTTTGTVLEGRTFGTAANSAVGDFIQNQNSSAQSANMWISGNGTFGGKIGIGTNNPQKKLVISNNGNEGVEIDPNGNIISFDRVTSTFKSFDFQGVAYNFGQGAATFASTVNATQLQSTVATGTAPLTVNSTTMVGNLNAQFINGTNLSRIISEKEFGNTGLYLQNNTVSWLNSAIDGAGGITSWTGNFLSFGKNDISYKTQFLISKTDFKFRGTYGNEDTQFNTIYHSGNLTSTLITNYIPKWNGSTFVNATAGTDYQLPITLTTNGTSGAATFSGNVLNVPNYDVSGGVNQTLTTVNGSTGGDIVGSMPFQTANYKKVIIYANLVSGNATYTFPTPFNTEWNVHTNTLGAAYSSVIVSGTSVTITGTTNAAGVLIIEGY